MTGILGPVLATPYFLQEDNFSPKRSNSRDTLFLSASAINQKWSSTMEKDVGWKGDIGVWIKFPLPL